jgi:predicted amidophosphoribosyltransferase
MNKNHSEGICGKCGDPMQLTLDGNWICEKCERPKHESTNEEKIHDGAKPVYEGTQGLLGEQ